MVYFNAKNKQEMIFSSPLIHIKQLSMLRYNLLVNCSYIFPIRSDPLTKLSLDLTQFCHH